MKNKNKIFLVLFCLILSFYSVSAYSSIGNIGGNMMNMGGNTMDMGFGDESDELDESSDDSVNMNSEINENLHFSKDGSIGQNTKVNGNIVAEKNLDIGSNVTINGNIKVKGNLTIGMNTKINGFVKVNGNLKIEMNSKILGTIYGYNKVSLGMNSETEGKFKSVGMFNAGMNYRGAGKLYAFGNKKYGMGGKFIDNKEKGILGKLDPYLKIDMTDDEFLEVKKITSEYDRAFNEVLKNLKKSENALFVANSKLKKAKVQEDKDALNSEISILNEHVSDLKSQGKDLVEGLITETKQYIETEEFDIKGVNIHIENEELAKLKLGGTYVKKGEENIIVNTGDKDKKFKGKIREMLEKKLSKYDVDKKLKLYDKLLPKLDKMIENTQNLKTKNTLILLKEVVTDLKEEASTGDEIDNVLNDIIGE